METLSMVRFGVFLWKSVFTYCSFLFKLIQKYKIFLLLFLSALLVIVDKLNIIETLFLECARLFFSGVLIFYLFEKYIKSNAIFFVISLLMLAISFVGNFKTFVFCPAILMIF